MHVFLSPHPDDASLSCGGQIALLRDQGEEVAIVTVFSGAGPADAALSPYQRAALGLRAAGIGAGAGDGDSAGDGPGDAARGIFRDGAAIAAARRAEDARFAGFAGVTILWLDIPDAVYRGYASDADLFGDVRSGDAPPVEALRRALREVAGASRSRAVPRIHAPLGVGHHVDHVLCRSAALALLPEYPDLNLYEDFPYAWWSGFPGREDAAIRTMPLRLTPVFMDISAVMDRKLAGVLLYVTQVGPLLGGADAARQALREYHARVAREDADHRAGTAAAEGYAERSWVPDGSPAATRSPGPGVRNGERPYS